MNEETGLIYFQDGTLVAESGEVRIYQMNDELFLEIGPGHTLWALSSEWEDYVLQLSDKPKGDCLEIGLGLGVASKYILSCPNVKTLTTVEINKDVIAAYNILDPMKNQGWGRVAFKDRHTIRNADGLIYAYNTKRTYDFIFIDCYDRIDEDTLPVIADLVVACKHIIRPEGYIVGWFDKNTPEEFIDPFFSIFI